MNAWLLAPGQAVAGVFLCLLAVKVALAQSPSPKLLAGMGLVVRLDTDVNSKTARVGDAVEAELDRPEKFYRTTVLPAGTRFRGLIEAARAANRQQKIPARVKLVFWQVQLPDGRTFPVDASCELQRFGTFDGDGNAVVAGTSGGMALLGALLGLGTGAKGAGIGAAIGGGLGLLIAIPTLVNQWRDLELKKGRRVFLQLDKDLDIPAAPRPGPSCHSCSGGRCAP